MSESEAVLEAGRLNAAGFEAEAVQIGPGNYRVEVWAADLDAIAEIADQALSDISII